MNAEKKVKKYLKENYGGYTKKFLQDDWGKLFRKTKVEGVFEVGTSYFYQSQARTVAFVEELEKYAGVTAEPVTEWGDKLNGYRLWFDDKPWPKTSFCKTFVRLEVRDEKVSID